MAGVAIVDRFLETFTSHIDSGFGLLRPEVAYLASALIVIDLVLVFSFAAWSNEDVLQRLAKKVLYVGFFAYLINHYSVLTGALFKSMAGSACLPQDPQSRSPISCIPVAWPVSVSKARALCWMRSAA